MPPLQQISLKRTGGYLQFVGIRSKPVKISGAGEDRTRDLLNAIQALYQLSHGPEIF